MAGGGKRSFNDSGSSQSLLVIVLDVCPYVWGERDAKRTASDKIRKKANKSSIGPVTLTKEILSAVQAFACSFCSLDRNSIVMIIAVANNEAAVVYPRKDHLSRFFSNPETYPPCDLRRLQPDFIQGVTELVTIAANKITKLTKAEEEEGATPANEKKKTPKLASSSAMAAGFSIALCCINRFLVATQTGVGVSALNSEQFLNRSDDAGVLAIMGGGINSSEGGRKNQGKVGIWSPRILMIQASEDRSQDYNAFMNCAFAAVKHNVVVDACFVHDKKESNSAFLHQACDLTGGVFLQPSGGTQLGGALTEVLLSVFLAPLNCRNQLALPSVNKVDFRARCFETGESVDMAFVCNQCLSIFKHKPKDHCPTCQADIKIEKRRKEN